ncbi:MAG: Sigma-54 dependent transcriptional regulator, partial [Labilithrix sp.]|nr:Sigma-54 dependent transcriptional regulator [Labilithrix sp.]
MLSVPQRSERGAGGGTKALDVLLGLAIDLTASLAEDDRYRRLLEGVRRLVPCDAACLLRLEGETFIPVASHGLLPDAMGRRYDPREHPRLEAIAQAERPVLFDPATTLADPFDGLMANDNSALAHVHACLGCPLRIDRELVGVLTADALDPHAFDGLDPALLAWLGALAGAAMHTSRLVDALEHSARRLGRVADDLMRAADERRGGELVGDSPNMRTLRKEIELVARSGLTVLVTGETGVGKELVARAIHAASPRHREPLLYVNCAALPESLAESELFGHVRGAFTGAEQHRAGKFEVADRGTLFLDEIGELPVSVQPKLLRALQEGEVQRVGADRPLKVDVRVVAATNRDLEREVETGRFRADLFHRLHVYPLHVPPLRERAEDIALLAGHFCDQARVRLGLGPVRLRADALRVLGRAPWPGNVRELENVVFRAVLQAAEGIERGQPVVVD